MRRHVVGGGSRARSRLGRVRHSAVRDRGSELGELVLQVVHVGQVWRQLGQLVERGDPDPLEEVAGGAVEVGTRLRVLPRLLHQSPGEQGAHDPVHVDASDG